MSSDNSGRPGYTGVQIGTTVRHAESGDGMVILAPNDHHNEPLVAWDNADLPPRRVELGQLTVIGYDGTVDHVVHAPGDRRHGTRASRYRTIAPFVHQ